VQPPHGTNLESLGLDALNDCPGKPPFDGIGFDDGECPFGHPAILSQQGADMTAMATKQQDDPDVHKGAIEGDRPTDEQHYNPNDDGVDENGMPDDPIGQAEDELGANEDNSQG